MPISQVGDKMPFPAQQQQRKSRKFRLGKSGQKEKSEVAHNHIAVRQRRRWQWQWCADLIDRKLTTLSRQLRDEYKFIITFACICTQSVCVCTCRSLCVCRRKMRQ